MINNCCGKQVLDVEGGHGVPGVRYMYCLLSARPGTITQSVLSRQQVRQVAHPLLHLLLSATRCDLLILGENNNRSSFNT